MRFPKIQDVEFFLAGGCVRDHLLNRPYHDRDFVVLTPLTFDELCDRINIGENKVWLAKPEFMTIRCRIDGESLDLTYPRIEGGYTDMRHPDFVSLATSLEEDSLRRDFTVNAMYMDETGRVFDYHNGVDDLVFRKIQTVRDPDITFGDDYLRMARAIRFSCTLPGEWIIEPNTFNSIARNVGKLVDVPHERIREEINKALLGNPPKAFAYISLFRLFPILENKGMTLSLIHI